MKSLREVEKRLGVRINVGNLLKRGRLTVYDKRLGLNRFVSEPTVEKVELEYIPPIIFVVMKVKLGNYRLKIPILMFDTTPE